MKILIAPDKFKGTLSASVAAAAIAEGVRRFDPSWQVTLLPIADGGEGTAEALSRASGGEMVKVRSSDPLFRPVGCEIGISGDGTTAFIDFAAASGFAHLQAQELDPLKTSSIGTGQLIISAFTRKCKRIVIGLGGSSTMDCGIGIAHALGAVFAGENEARISPIGANLARIEFVNLENLRPELKRTEILLLTDVDCGLLGDDGAMQFGPQKGLRAMDADKMAGGLQHFSNFMEVKFNTLSKTAGMGAAGGAAMSCVGLLGAKIAPGAAFVMEALHMQAAIADADLIITGEGHLDAQSLRGKSTIALARLAQQQGKTVAAICGQISLSENALRKEGIDVACALHDGPVHLDAVRAGARFELTTRTREMLEDMALTLG